MEHQPSALRAMAAVKHWAWRLASIFDQSVLFVSAASCRKESSYTTHDGHLNFWLSFAIVA